MPATDTARNNAVRAFEFDRLFVELLGWNRGRGVVPLEVDGVRHNLTVIADKGEIPVLLHTSATIPDAATRAKFLRAARKNRPWNIVIFTDEAMANQVWAWEVRLPGRPARPRERAFSKGIKEQALREILPHFEFPIEIEEDIGHLHVVERLENASKNAEKVTTKFYKRFEKEHTAFLGFIKGIQHEGDRRWYASLMLNRLMFIYFIQKKGFLDGDPEYLAHRLERVRLMQGKDKFFSFYRDFLLRLFHEGLNAAESSRSAELEALIGDVPYLNGGFFEVHKLEEANPEIAIPDEAFETIFEFFDGYSWYLDERPLESDNEINPDVLGYIFEKYINQKQMGAYYTKEDITEYIGKNTIIPWILETAFADQSVSKAQRQNAWDLLAEAPDRYIYPAVLKGADVPLPPDIERGIGDVSKREGWNRPAPAEFALPTETWREHIARRQRCHELRAKLSRGELTEINDLITPNLHIGQFAEDVIRYCESPKLLKALYKAINSITVLDPTCGSGAFLFAALNILEPLYEACLHQAEALSVELASLVRPASDTPALEPGEMELAAARRRQYGIYKAIILQNLYGVDIMEEAVEICKLRLFLKLVSQLEPADGIEPLPDIDFNIRAGNTLVGYVTKDSVERALTQQSIGTSSDHLGGVTARVAVAQVTMDITGERQAELVRFLEDAELADKAYKRFHSMQTEQQMLAGDFRDAKKELRVRLDALHDRLNRCLAVEYGIAPDGPGYEVWLTSHQPFHWFVEFYGIISGGGFNVVIGNPPYLPLRDLADYEIGNYSTIATGNLYAVKLERFGVLCSSTSRQGYIVPVSSISTDGYASLQEILLKRDFHFASFDDRPSRLFEGLEHIRLTVLVIGTGSKTPTRWSTTYNKWSSVERETLFHRLKYEESNTELLPNSFLKLSSPTECGIVEKLRDSRRILSQAVSKQGSYAVQYSRKVGYFLQALDFEPTVIDEDGKLRPPSKFKRLAFDSLAVSEIALGILNSNLFYWFITVGSDCRHLNRREVSGFPVDLIGIAEDGLAANMHALTKRLMDDIRDNSEIKRMRFDHVTLDVQHIYPKYSKAIIDEIDHVLAKHYGFTDEELDFIINYDIKYRMGRDAGGDEDQA